jgi:hypothetical protein
MQELASTQPPDFFPEAWKTRCNEYSVFNLANDQQEKKNTPYAVVQAYTNAALISL